MEFSVIHGSQNLYIEGFIEVVSFSIFFFLIHSYYKKKITVLQLILWGLATQTFTFYSIGPTISPLFLIGLIFMAEEIVRLIKFPIIKRRALFYLLFPVFTFIVVTVYSQFDQSLFFYPNGFLQYVLRFPYFYIKEYLILIVFFVRLSRESPILGASHFNETIIQIGVFSIFISIFQMLNIYIFNSQFFGEVVGLRYGDAWDLVSSGSFYGRVQAFFIEPRNYGAFLGISIPILFFERRYILLVLSIIIGILTQSQTFFVILFLSFVCLIYFLLKNIRASLFFSLMFVFVLFSASTYVFISLLPRIVNQDSVLSKILVKRSIDRFSGDGDTENIVMGMPLQPDLEFPIYKYFHNNPFLVVTGYGPGNSTFIPADYFYGQRNYEEHLRGVGSVGITMGLFYLMAEYGLIFFIVTLFLFTDNIKHRWIGYYVTFLWIAFFFSRIDYILMSYLVVVYQGGGVRRLSLVARCDK